MDPAEINKTLGRQLRQERRAKSLTMEQLAQAIGVSVQQVQKYETGSSAMSAARVFQIARVLDLPLNRLFAGLTAGN
jgi:transcriptional regulator with XRE-family HTH domain